MRATECFSMYSDMSRRTIACSSSNRNSATARASSVLPTPVGPRNRNEPIGRFGSLKPERLRRIAFATAGQRRVLADDAIAQPLFHVHQLLNFAFEQTARRNSRPFADDLGDFFLADFFLQHRMIFLQLGQLVLRRLQFFFRGGKLAVANFRHSRKIAGAFVALLFGLQAGRFLP